MDTTNKIIEVTISEDKYHLIFTLNLFILFVAVIFVVGLIYFIKYLNKKKTISSAVKDQFVPIEMTFEIGGVSTKYQIVRNYANIEIAHKIYIELITRKASISFDEDNDLIIEIYNSWYSLFQITRNELKTLTGDLLLNNDKSKDLVCLATDILNKGLRPHLTKFQAKYRKWHQDITVIENAKSITDKKSPQEIQREYPEYDELVSSIKNVNVLLLDYSKQLEHFLSYK